MSLDVGRYKQVSDRADFWLAWPTALVTWVIVLFAPTLVLAWPHPYLLALALGFAAFTIAVLGLPVILSVTGEGLVWSGFSKLPWSQITSVRRVSLVGLPYLIVYRTRGFRWWLPLYIRGPVSFESAVGKLAPHDNPLYAYVSSGIGAQPVAAHDPSAPASQRQNVE